MTAAPARPRAEIAIIRARYNPYGGAERFVQRALAALQDRDVSVTVIARRWPADAARDGETAVPIRFERVDPFYLGSVWRDAGFARGVHALLAQRHFDLVQSHERIPGIGLYRAGDGVHAEFLAQRNRAMPAWRRALPSANPYHGWMLRTERAMFEHPALRAVIVNSRMVRDEILAHFRIDAGKLHLVRNGVDLQRFAPPTPAARAAARSQFGVAGDRPVLAFVGSGFERKGLAQAIGALAERSAPADALLLVAGADKHRDRYSALAARCGVADRVRLLGSVADVVPVLHAADAFVLPTLYDPFPNAVLEALACGLPAVTSTKSGAAETILDAGAAAGAIPGVVVDALDVAGIAAALRRCTDPAAAPAMRGAARRSVEPLSVAALGDELVALYTRLLAG